MKFKSNLHFIVFFLFLVPFKYLIAQPVIGTKFSRVSLDKENGALVKGGAWDSKDLEDPAYVKLIFYVDPDERDTNQEASEAIKKAGFEEDVFKSYAIINLGATWLPNAFIESSLEKKQKEFSRTVYVKDFKKYLVKNWGLADDASVVVLVDKDGIVRFYHAGKLDSSKITTLLETTKKSIGEIRNEKASSKQK